MAIQRLSDTMDDGVQNVYFSDGFHSMMEHHILTLATSSKASIIDIPNALANQYAGDLFGLLNTLAVPSRYHWVTMRCNKLHAPHNYTVDKTTIIQPNFEEIDELQAIYSSSANLSL
jgi:hypothetical protein